MRFQCLFSFTLIVNLDCGANELYQRNLQRREPAKAVQYQAPSCLREEFAIENTRLSEQLNEARAQFEDFLVESDAQELCSQMANAFQQRCSDQLLSTRNCANDLSSIRSEICGEVSFLLSSHCFDF
jgi:hypothetical protein